jgi:hypothetical protein
MLQTYRLTSDRKTNMNGKYVRLWRKSASVYCPVETEEYHRAPEGGWAVYDHDSSQLLTEFHSG